MPMTPAVRTRLAKLVRMLGASEGEAMAAVGRIKAVLDSEKLSFTDLGDLIEKAPAPQPLHAYQSYAQRQPYPMGGMGPQTAPPPHRSAFDDDVEEFIRKNYQGPFAEQTRAAAEKWRNEKRKMEEKERERQQAERVKNLWAMSSDKDVRAAVVMAMDTLKDFLQPWEMDYLHVLSSRTTFVRAMRDKVGEIVDRAKQRRAAA